MQIPAYQIHNVLNTYSLQLYKAGTAAGDGDCERASSINRISPEMTRQAVIDKVAEEIVQRITRLDALPESPPASTAPADSAEIRSNQFVFNTLDTRNMKIPQTLSIEDSIFFIKRGPSE